MVKLVKVEKKKLPRKTTYKLKPGTYKKIANQFIASGLSNAEVRIEDEDLLRGRRPKALAITNGLNRALEGTDFEATQAKKKVYIVEK